MFDKNDKFYHDICTPYKSIDGTDVILFDRINDIYEKNKLECQENCEYSDYLPELKYLKCECKTTNQEKIETKEPEKITAKSVKNSFFNVLKYSNYKVLYCYNLVFRKVTIKENVGSILSNIYFIGYLIAFLIFCYNKASYLKTEIDKLLKGENSNKNDITKNKDNIIIYNKNNINETKNFDNEIKIKEKNNEEIEEGKEQKIFEDNNNDIIEIKKTKIKKKMKKYKRKSDVINNDYNNIIKQNENIGKEHDFITIKDINKAKDILYDNRDLSSKDIINNQLDNIEQDSIQISSKNQRKDKMEDSNKNSKDEKEDLTDYELNDLDYEEALELDNRNFLKIYWYLLKREHIILFTFFNWNDYNFFSIKLSKLFLSVCSDMAFNVFFFSDESMHKTYETGGEHDWVGQLAQMVYSTIISQILQIFVNYLTMTDIHYYQLKELKKNNNINGKEALSVIKCIKIKIIAYFSSTFLMFLFFWYSCSAFCAVYANTQGIFIADSYTSFLMELLYPFVLYLAPTALRILSLKVKEKKNLKILYSLSDKIPIF